MKNLLWLVAWTCVLALWASGCGRDSSTTRKRLYMVQALKGHPVHQITQTAFADKARALGYEPVIVGTDGPDLAGTIALAEQTLAAGNVAGMCLWTGNPGYNPLIRRCASMNIPVILPHFPVGPEEAPGAKGVISCDPAAYAAESAERIGKAIAGQGAVAITQGSFNTTENLVTEIFTKTMKAKYPNVKVLPAIEEGFDAPAAITKAVSLIRANPDLTAALSTTGGGPVVWASAQREAGKKLIVVGMDYTHANLDLVRDGQVFGIIGQPLWEESAGAAELLDKCIKGEKIEWWTKLPAPFITKDNLAPHYERLKKVDAALGKK